MLVRVQTIGTGADGDPVRVMMPTCRVIDVDYANKRAIVDLPLEDAPDDVDAPGSPNVPLVNGLPVVTRLTPAQRLRWRARLARRWAGLIDTSNFDVQ